MTGTIDRLEGTTLVDALDRLLERGVALQGDVVLSVAGIDLVWLGLQACLGGVEHAPPGASIGPVPACSATPGRTVPGGSPGREKAAVTCATRTGPSLRPGQPGGPRRLDVPEERTEAALVRLVLSVVELLRQLMERQALRRAEDPDLADEDVERLGLTLLRLAERMEELKTYFGLTDDDLELGLGSVHDLG